MDPFLHWLETGLHELDSEIEFTASELAAHFTRFNREIGRISQNWSDSQMAKGIHHLYGRGSCYVAEISKLPPGPQVDDFFASLTHLYTDLFEVRCSRFFSHLDRGPEQPNPLNGPCYMLWDMDAGIDSFRFSGISSHVDNSLLLLERLAESTQPAVFESAIHGLGHMIVRFHDRCQPPFERILARDNTPTELRQYAYNAIYYYIQ